MKYNVVYDKQAVKSFSKLDQCQQNMIAAWIEKNLVQTANPRKHGKVINSKLKEYWRYRIGNYRLLADINAVEIKIIMIDMGHRQEIYR